MASEIVERYWAKEGKSGEKRFPEILVPLFRLNTNHNFNALSSACRRSETNSDSI